MANALPKIALDHLGEVDYIFDILQKSGKDVLTEASASQKSVPTDEEEALLLSCLQEVQREVEENVAVNGMSFEQAKRWAIFFPDQSSLKLTESMTELRERIAYEPVDYTLDEKATALQSDVHALLLKVTKLRKEKPHFLGRVATDLLERQDAVTEQQVLYLQEELKKHKEALQKESDAIALQIAEGADWEQLGAHMASVGQKASCQQTLPHLTQRLQRAADLMEEEIMQDDHYEKHVQTLAVVKEMMTPTWQESMKARGLRGKFLRRWATQTV